MEPSQPSQPQAAQPAAPQRQVLCIEDEHFISELYVRALKKAGYAVTTAIDGETALKEAQSDKYDIILLDIMIPTITGIEILRKLRDPSITPNKIHSKIVITTNLDQGEEARAAIEQQADGYIIKAEVTPRQLVEFLDQLDTNK